MSLKTEYIHSCDRVRKTPEGELFWQYMMTTSTSVSEEEFLANVNIDNLLEEGETWNDYKMVAVMEGIPLEFFSSEDGSYFFQQGDFEFIWKNQIEIPINEMINKVESLSHNIDITNMKKLKQQLGLL